MKQKWVTPIVILLTVLVFGLTLGFLYHKPGATPKDRLAYVDGHYALPEGGGIGGDLWTIDPITLQKKRVTKSGNIAYIFDWSPDNKYIAVQLGDKVNSALSGRYTIVPTIAVIETNTGKIIRLKEDTAVRGQLMWESNDNLVYLRSELNKSTTFSTISITDKSEHDLMTIPKDNDDSIFGFIFSPDMQSAVIVMSYGENKKPSIYSYNVTSNHMTLLRDIDFSNLIGWISNKIIYFERGPQGNAILEVNNDGSNKKKLIDLGKNSIDSFAMAPSGNKIIFVEKSVQKDDSANQTLISYDYGSTNVKAIPLSGPLSFIGIKVSTDGKYVSELGAKVINLNSGKITQNYCTGSYCFNYSWSR